MSQVVEVRMLGNQDVFEHEDALRGLLLENAQVNFLEVDDPAALAESWFSNLERFMEDGSAVVLGAFLDGSLRGFLWAHRRVVLGRERMHVGQVCVHPDARSRGIGQRMLERVERIARDEGLCTIELMTTMANTAARRFYRANGFVATRVQMEKDLSEAVAR